MIFVYVKTDNKSKYHSKVNRQGTETQGKHPYEKVLCQNFKLCVKYYGILALEKRK